MASDRTQQIAFAPVHRLTGHMAADCIRVRAKDARAAITDGIAGGWPRILKMGWRIRKVRIEIDE